MKILLLTITGSFFTLKKHCSGKIVYWCFLKMEKLGLKVSIYTL